MEKLFPDSLTQSKPQIPVPKQTEREVPKKKKKEKKQDARKWHLKYLVAITDLRLSTYFKNISNQSVNILHFYSLVK